VIGYSPNRGKGYAVRAGLLAARGRFRIFTDVDLAYRLADVARVADELACSPGCSCPSACGTPRPD
jgi:dolichyl-phosphate beta-glucosyltransferase